MPCYMGLAGIFFLTCGWFPAHDPTWTPTELRSFYNDNLARFTVGTLCAMTVVALYIPYYATVSKILEYKLRMPLLGRIQNYASIQAGMFVFLMFLCWAVPLPAGARSRDHPGLQRPWLVHGLVDRQHDRGAVPGLGAAILFCRPENQLYKRWLGHFFLLAFFAQIFAWIIPP